ncbi:MAG: methyltransferase, partial [Panacibacter sp.]
NTFFRFKRFTVQQENCAMKVCTDACLFGAWVAQKVKNEKSKVKRVLDIGTGTGLLSLMLAQQTNAFIDAIEIDEAAAMQAGQNFATSPWKERLHIHHTSVQQYTLSTVQQYDIIICNPPFFENDLRSDNAKRNLALHSTELSLEELLQAVHMLLKEDGCFAILLPFHRGDYFEKFASVKHYYLRQKILVRQTPSHSYFRTMLFFNKQPCISAVEKKIIIQNENREYTDDFILLLRDYYLHL